MMSWLYGSTDIKISVTSLKLSLILVDIEKLEMSKWARPAMSKMFSFLIPMLVISY